MTNLEVTSVEYDREVEAPDNATVTTALPLDIVQEEIARVVREAENLAEDLALAVVIRTRLEHDSGERVSLADFIRQEGFDPGDFGVE